MNVWVFFYRRIMIRTKFIAKLGLFINKGMFKTIVFSNTIIDPCVSSHLQLCVQQFHEKNSCFLWKFRKTGKFFFMKLLYASICVQVLVWCNVVLFVEFSIHTNVKTNAKLYINWVGKASVSHHRVSRNSSRVEQFQ